MAEERLSRLQKWILEFVYNQKNQVAHVTTLKYYAHRNEELFKNKSSRNSLHVIFSRSLRNLERKDLTQSLAANMNLNKYREVRGLDVMDGEFEIGNMKAVFLTDEGEAKAKELLNVKKEKLNNKRGS